MRLGWHGQRDLADGWHHTTRGVSTRTLDPPCRTPPTPALTPILRPCLVGSRRSAARYAIWSTPPTPMSAKPSSEPTVHTSCCRATSAPCWRPRTTSTYFSTTAPSFLIPRESSLRVTTIRLLARS